MNVSRLLFRLLLGRRLPVTSGTIEVGGLTRPVVIKRDGWGIPYIQAESDEDGWYGLGFCHGQDRAFQLETLARVVRGTLSELVGPDGLVVDRLSRRIGFHHSAEQQLDALDENVRMVAEAYARGATEGTRLGCRRRAHEFALLRATPVSYQVTDVVGFAKLQSFLMAANWDVELARLKIVTGDGPEALAALDPSYPEWHPVSAPPGAEAGPLVDRLAEDLAIFTSVVGLGGGSNNWALAPSRTKSGRALVANDPHLPPLLPPPGYLAHIRTPEWTVSGATFVGAPIFPVGHNDVAAWGITAGLVDNTDLFIEEIGPDGSSVRQGDEFVPCESRREVISVKGGQPVVEDVLTTPRGPIIGPALEGAPTAISLRATWLDPRPVKGLLAVHRCRSFEEFRRSFDQWPLLSLNMVYADTSGSVGWQLAGEVPQRRKGSGTLPMPGWDRETGWNGSVPFDEMPHLVDPECGFVATANNQPIREGEGPFLGADWVDGYRQARIVEALSSRNDWDLAGASALQMDQKSVPWDECREIILNAPADTADVRYAIGLLTDWGGVVSADSPAGALFELFLTEMSQRVAKAMAPASAEWALGKGFGPVVPHTFFMARRVGHLIRLLRDQPEGWFQRAWPDEIADALGSALAGLRTKYGPDVQDWSWGRVRPLTLRNLVGDRPPLGRVFNRGPFPWGGDANTISQAPTDPMDPTASPLIIASLRAVMDVGNWEDNSFSLAGGQSGNPASRHYDDLLPLWLCGEGVSVAWSAEKVDEIARSTLRLEPEARIA